MTAPVSRRQLARWLVDNGYADERRGYGHASGDEIAEALLARYDISEKAAEPDFSDQDDPPLFPRGLCRLCDCPKGDHEDIGDGEWTCDGCDGYAGHTAGWCTVGGAADG